MPYVPPPDDRPWETVDPADHGWDPAALEDLATFCASQATEQLIVASRGRLMLERCWQGAEPASVRDVGSVQKGVTSVLVGSLVDREQLSLDDPVSRWLGEGWTRTDPDRERAITLRHLVTMSSGLYDDFGYEASPGTLWYYNNNAYHQVRKVLEAVTGKSTQALSEEFVFGPLSMAHSTWVPRPAMVDPSGWVLCGLQTCARDLVRFGLMIQGRGRSGDSVVLDQSGYLDAALSSSQELNPSYGYLWWLPSRPWAVVPGPDPAVAPDPRKAFGGRRLEHPIAPSAPDDAKAALGIGGQRLYVSAGLDLVFARIGGAVDEHLDFDEELWRRLRAASPDTATPP